MIFNRDTYTSLWLTLRSDEPLGLLDSSYLEDETGLRGYLTIRHSSGQSWQMPMSELPTETPNIPHDVFTGSLPLSSLPNGDFQIRGRVRDLTGNHTILSSVANPIGDERLVVLEFLIAAGRGLISSIGALRLEGARNLGNSHLDGARNLQGHTLARTFAPVRVSTGNLGTVKARLGAT